MIEFFVFSLALFVVGVSALYWALRKKKRTLAAADSMAKSIAGRAERDAERVVDLARDEARQIVQEARGVVEGLEQKAAQLRDVDRELQSRLEQARARLETMTDIAGEKAGGIDLINEDDLLSTRRYQEDRKAVKASLKAAAQNAEKNLSGRGASAEIGKYIGVSARSDMTGALLVITAEMLCSKITHNNGHASLQKLDDSISAAGALLKAFDSRAELDPKFKELLVERLMIEIDYKRARQVSRDRQAEVRAQEREEAQARKEAEKAEAQARYDEELKRQAISELGEKMRSQSEAERALYQTQLEDLQRELAEAQEKAERARSRAQDTKQGHVYIISNVGSFGENVLKIGMTRRMNPLDRVRELSDASVPFSFDVHALIESDDAPALENALHRLFDERRLNRVNNRKEFFRVTIEEIEQKLHQEGVAAMVIPVASADEYYESIRLASVVSDRDGAD